MKRLIAAILMIAMLTQAVPVISLADGGTVIRDTELREALLLAGLRLENQRVVSAVKTYRSGMKPDESWDAEMLRSWATEMLEERAYPIADSLQRAHSVLARMKAEDPAAHARLTGMHSDWEEIHSLGLSILGYAVKVQSRLKFQKERLEECIVMAEQMTDLLTDGTAFEYEAVRYSEKLRSATEQVQKLRGEMITDTSQKTEQLIEFYKAIKGTYTGNDALMLKLNSWLSSIFDWESGQFAGEEARATVRRSGNTIQNRLAAFGAGKNPLRGDSGDAKIHIRSENEVYFHIFGEDNQPLQGVTVTIWDEANPDRPSVSDTTDEDGYVYLTISQFTANTRKELRLSMEAAAEPLGYQDIYAQDFLMVQGEERSEYLTKLDGPYIYKGSFQGYDVMRKEWDMLYATANDNSFDLEIVVRDPDKEGYEAPVLHFTNQDGNPETEAASSASGDTYTFTGSWKCRFLPEAKEKPFFTFGESGKRTDTLLVSKRSPVDEPTYSGEETTSPLNSLLKDGFGFKLSLPFTDSISMNIDFALPLSNYWPKVVLTPVSCFVTFGSTLTDPEGKLPAEWKNANQRDYENHMADWKDLDYLSKKQAEAGAAYKYYKNSKLKLLQKAELNFGWFGVFCAKVDQDEQFDTWLAKVSGNSGMILTFSYDMTFPFTLAGIPFYVNLNFGLSAGFSFGLGVEFAIAGGEFTSVSFAGFADQTVELAFCFTFTFGLGIKGIVSAYLSATACLNLAIAMSTTMPVKVSPSFSVFAKAGVEVLIMDVSVIVMAYPSDSRHASSGKTTLFDLFMSRAAAEDEPEDVKVVSQTPLRYPELAPEATELIHNQQDRKQKIKVASAKGFDYACYLGTNEDGDQVLYCKNFTTGNKEEAISQFSQYYIYDFDVYTDGEFLYTVTCHARMHPGEMLPDPDTDYIGLMSGFRIQDNGGLEMPGSYAAFYTAQEQELCYTALADPHIEQASVTDEMLNMICSFGEIEGYGNHVSAVSSETGVITYHDMNAISPGSGGDYRFVKMRALITDNYHYDPEENERTGFIATTGKKDDPDPMAGNTIELFDSDMYQAAESDCRSLTLNTGCFSDFQLLQTRGDDGQYFRTVFYADTVFSSGEDKEGGDPDEVMRIRLKGIHVDPKQAIDDDSFEISAALTDYDVCMPTAKFDVQMINATPVLYWLSTAPAENMDDPVVWRLSGVSYDPDSNYMSDTFVIAEFTLPDTVLDGQAYPTIPGDITLTASGTGYMTTLPDTGTASVPGQEDQQDPPPMSLYSFPIDLKPVVGMQDLALSETLVTPGQMIDAAMTLMNEGNLIVSGLDLEMVQVKDDGSEGPVLETVHADFLHPENNSLTMADGTQVLSGEDAFYRKEDYTYSGKQRDWAREKYTVVYTVQSGVQTDKQTSEKDTEYISTDLMVPGSLAAFDAGIEIPQEEEWQGDIMLRLRVQKIVSFTKSQSVLAAAATAGKGNRFTLPEGARELVWELNRATGRLELQTPGLSAAEQSLYAREIITPVSDLPLKVEHQDITADYRLGMDFYGEPMLDIIIGNRVNNREKIRLTCAVYPDGSNTPYYVSLPYYEEYVSAGMTQTISMPLKTLADPAMYSRVRVVISGIGIEESNYFNNEFTLNLSTMNRQPLSLIRQPADAVVQKGEDAVFTVEAAGGSIPYTYRWEVWMGESLGWRKIEGSDDPTLTVKNTTKAMDGWKYRCVVTDAAGAAVTSRAAGLTVTGVPGTGDSSNPVLYLTLAAAALALLWILRKKKPSRA